MPDCPTEGKAGNITRCNQLLQILNDSGNEVDFLSISDWGTWTKESKEKFFSIYPNINLILTNRKIDIKTKPIQSLFFYKIPNLLPKIIRGFTIDISNPFLNKKITKIINSKKYDQIIVSYASWSSIIDGLKYKSHLILDSHDFITGQSNKKLSKIGKIFQREINAINKFDEIWTFSIEEKYIFEQFSKANVFHIPISFPLNFQEIKPQYNYDVLYVASSNPHNIKSINWFLEHVLPNINKQIKIHIIGKIGKEIQNKNFENIIIHGIVDDLNVFYKNAKMTICPMLSGTGVKIKVLESLSFGLPVITNTRGVDGLSQKSQNGCIVTDDAFEFASKINQLMVDQKLYCSLVDEAIQFFKTNHHEAFEHNFFKSKFS